MLSPERAYFVVTHPEVKEVKQCRKTEAAI
jgi:hypothetical protein